MSGLLKVSPGDTALEIGTGSGYQAAVLATLLAVHWGQTAAVLAAAALYGIAAWQFPRDSA